MRLCRLFHIFPLFLIVHTVAWSSIGDILVRPEVSRDFFGVSVAQSGDYLVVGAFGDNTLGQNAGAAHVYRNVNHQYIYEAALRAQDGTEKDRFGFSVAIEGTTVVVGA